MKKATRITVLALLVLMITSIFCTYALAAKACSYISGSASYCTTFTIKTNKKWFSRGSLTIKLNKGVGIDQSTGKPKEAYGMWYVTVYDKNGEKVRCQSNYFGYGSIKITGLKRNSTYTVKVEYDSNLTAIGSYIFRWAYEPTWSVSQTKNITMCK